MMLYYWIVWLKVTSAGGMPVAAGHDVAEPPHGTSWCHSISEHFEECRIAGLNPLASSHPSALRGSSCGLLDNPSVFSILVTSCFLTNQSGRDGHRAISLDGEGNYYVGAVRPRPRPACGEADHTRCFPAHCRVHRGILQ